MVINEIAWGGTAANPLDEWIELYNAGESAADLAGWALYEGSTRIILLSGTISPGAYYLVERQADDTVSDIPAGVFGTFSGGGLSNTTCEILTLKDSSEGVVDSTACNGADWPGGAGSPSYVSMERISASMPGSDASNWASNDDSVTTGLDAAGQPLSATPGYRNSVTP